MQRIAVGYDGSPGSRRALEKVAELAHAFDSDVIVATIDEYVPSLVATGSVADVAAISQFGSADVARAAEEDAERLAHEAQALLLAENVQSRPVSLQGSVNRELAEIAAEYEADLIVVGASEPGFVARLLSGSTGASLARHAPCDVLIVHP